MLDSFFYFFGVCAVAKYLIYQFASPISIALSYLKEAVLPMTKKTLVQRYGTWAVITGSSDGLGKEYAKQMAAQGFNIVLIARNEEKLKRVQKDIENESNVEVKYIIADFTDGYHIYEKIENQLADIPVGVLVNNVGLAHYGPASFDDHAQKLVWDIIIVNISAALMMTKIVLPGMKNRGLGAIVNISSICVLAPLINNGAVYSSTKTFLSTFTKTLQWEVMNYPNIDVQLLEPFFMKTKMIDFSTEFQNHILTAKCEDYARSAISLLGRTNYSNGYFKHSLFSAIMSILPETVRIIIIYISGKFFESKYQKE